MYITPSEDFDDLQEPKAQQIITPSVSNTEIFRVFFITDIFLNVYISIVLLLPMSQIANIEISDKNTNFIAFFQTLLCFLYSTVVELVDF